MKKGSKHSDESKLKISITHMSNFDDVWKHVNKKSDEECWEWIGYKDKGGYGTIRFRNKQAYAHRLIYEIVCGKISEGLSVLHTCDNPSCVNPKHLFLGTQQDNINDAVAKKRMAVGSHHGMSKLVENEAKEIRKLYSTGLYSQRKLGKMFCVDQHQIYCIVNYKTWKNI